MENREKKETKFAVSNKNKKLELFLIVKLIYSGA